ncbi:hypothetical protein M0813_04112 [Anaeramoeba flamelloides]|uniref:Uncharacterized protein n=1 Tax=Anaeramoeba flamelloides TaxID=1746091 RepID=A0ABQ8XPG8_9EUKA|nr:hypothetical protein M0813_04112 [Anaeramoeba flamelloides]
MIYQTTTTKALKTKTENIIPIPQRTRTKNQKRIELLLETSPRSVSGLTQLMLKLPNCPKEVKVSSSVIDTYCDKHEQKTVNKKELILFMIKKYNLFYDPNAATKTNKSDHSYLTFRNCQVSGIDSLIKLANSKKFDTKQLSKITKKLYWWKQRDPLTFVGLENEHFQEWFQPPHKVQIAKTVLKQFCTEPRNKKIKKAQNQKQNNSSQSSEIKKLYRAFSFFFSARFNCINISNKSRTEMKFGRNYKSGFGDSKIKTLGIDLDEFQDEEDKTKTKKKAKIMCSNFSQSKSKGKSKGKSKRVGKGKRNRKISKKNKYTSSRKRKHSTSSSKKKRKKNRDHHSLSRKYKYKSYRNEEEDSFDDYSNSDSDSDRDSDIDIDIDLDLDNQKEKLNYEQIKKTKKRKKYISFVTSSSSSGEETERDDYHIYSQTKTNQNLDQRKIRKIILTENRNNLNSNLLQPQSMLSENENTYFEELKNKTENELEDELLSLLLNLKNSQN